MKISNTTTKKKLIVNLYTIKKYLKAEGTINTK